MTPELAAVLGAAVGALCSLLGGVFGYWVGYERRDMRARKTEDRLMDVLDEERGRLTAARSTIESLLRDEPCDPALHAVSKKTTTPTA